MEDNIFGCSSSNDTEKESHAFCRECLQNYTEMALESKPFSRGWLGLKCMAQNCENPIPWQELKAVLPDMLESIQALENQCAELCVSAAKEFEENAPNENMECPICCDYVTYDQLYFCDHLIGDSIFGSSSNNAQKESHAFCRECLNGYTKAALETKPFARGWLGLKCMAEKCENPIPWQEIKKNASPDELETIKTLENCCAELDVSSAGLCIERCTECNCAVEMDVLLPVADNGTTNNQQKAVKPYEKLKFHCPECNYKMCRKCNEKWGEEHNHLTCEQFAKQQNREGYFRDKQKTEEEIKKRKYAKCPGCKTHVEKKEGCQFMNCRCGTCFWYCCGEKADPKAGHYSHKCSRA
ncbi:hypothetical protein niasHT_018057 [Heterodera trifolii]|uniref:RING-type domain-containing protein n=1 Tax=Heterodera trifolii TaxID=157864 RepID=A0ABD2L138_9BILA